MGFLSERRAKSKEVNRLMTSVKTLCAEINDTRTTKQFFADWDEITEALNTLVEYEKEGYRFNPTLSSEREKIMAAKGGTEIGFVNRFYAKAQWDAGRESTEEGAAEVFKEYFDELDGYVDRMEPKGVAYWEQKKYEHEHPGVVSPLKAVQEQDAAAKDTEGEAVENEAQTNVQESAPAPAAPNSDQVGLAMKELEVATAGLSEEEKQAKYAEFFKQMSSMYQKENEKE